MVEVMRSPYISYADYFEAELASDTKHEWFDGAVYAMSRGTPEHARLSTRIARVLGNALLPDCEVYSSDLMLYVAAAKLSTYADAAVICGPVAIERVVKNDRSLGEAVTNPQILVAVAARVCAGGTVRGRDRGVPARRRRPVAVRALRRGRYRHDPRQDDRGRRGLRRAPGDPRSILNQNWK
jgi:hypothetical protein